MSDSTLFFCLVAANFSKNLYAFGQLLPQQYPFPYSKQDNWRIELVLVQYKYHFSFRMHGSDWRFELDKECNAGAWYTLHCSTQELHLPIHYIKDLRIFCQQIGRLQQMQNDYLASKYK